MSKEHLPGLDEEQKRIWQDGFNTGFGTFFWGGIVLVIVFAVLIVA